MGVFDNCSMLLELKHLSIKEKKKLKSAVTENGGSISFVVNQQCSLVVTSDVSNLSSSRLRSIQKHQTPVVGLDYVHSCVERGTLLPVDGYKLDPSSTPSAAVNPPRRAPLTYQADPPNNQISLVPAERTDKEKFRIHTELDSDPPPFPSDFQVAKYSIFEKADTNSWCVLELQSARTEQGQRYRVVRYWKDDVATKEAAVKDQLVFLSTSEKALEVYEALRDQLDSSGLQRRSSIPPEVPHLGSAPLQQLLLEETLSSGSLSQEVGVFVEMLWTEALGCLNHILRVSINKLSLNDVSRAEGLLLQAQKKLKEGDQTNLSSLLKEVYILLPHREPQPPLPTAKFLSQKLDLCQLIRDVLNVSEMTLRSSQPSSVGKYRALQCSIEAIAPNSIVFQNIASLLNDSPVQIHQIMRVSRGVELQTFKSELGNIRPLLHSSSPSNFVGILSRGLLLPRVGVEHHGIERTDVGNLGSGIYFSDAVSTSLKYSKPGETDGSRLLLVCDVALGRCKDVHRRDQTLSQAPEGHHSVHGVRRTHSNQSDFEDNEFVVYSPDQVKVKYVVQFTVEGDHLKDFHPAVNTSAELSHAAVDEELVSVEDIENIKNPLEDVKAGLLDSSGQQLPLQAVHVKCKLMDLLSQVIIFQKYTNLSSVPIEAKYVFPLDDSAAVCGFEAFINGKHVVGQVKEKETARKEYKQAIEKGHGAYLMDQDAPDVFTISVGNLPPGATVLIKVTFVSELVVKDGSILFSLPGSVAPWQESAALNQTTQVSVEKVCVTDEAAGVREFTLDVSVEMPHEISNLLCITHQVKMKRTDCKAVVRVLPDQVMGPDGFQLSITLSEVHLPRMWVEKHPDKDSQACMLVFYPDFELDSGSEVEEVVLLLDTSESMRGESLRLAQNIALQVLRKLENNVRVNVVLFGTDHTEALLKAQPLVEVRQTAERFIKRCSPAGGSTELWRPLKALSLLPPSRGARNLLLLSDGHIQNSALTLQLLRDNVQHSRLFTCGLSPTANRHMLRALAQAGGGAYEFFDTKTKHNWAEKVLRQVKRMSSPGCSSVSVKWQQFNPTAPSPVQAPKQLHALFRDCHTLVYGFVPHCTQATLLGNLQGQELKTMVSTSELQKTRGTFLHKLTARALIRDYEDGSLDTTEAEHEGKKAELKSFIIELSKEFSILSQFTSFVAIEERDSNETEDGVTDIPKLIEEEDVDFLPYISWTQDSVGLDMSSINDDLGDDMEMSSINDDLGDDMGASVSSFNFQVAYYKLRDEDDDDEVEVRSKSFLKTAEEQETPEEQQMKNGYKPQFHLPRVIQSPCRSELPFRQPYLKTKFICTGAPEPLTYLSSAPTPESAQASLASVSRMGSEAFEGAGGLFGSAPTSPEPAPSASTAPTFGPQLLDMAQNGSPLSAGGLYGLSQIPRIAFGDLSSGSLPHFPRSRQAGFQFHSPPSDEASRVTSPQSPKDEDPNLDCDLRYDVRRSQRRMLEKSVMKKSSVEMDIIKCGSNLSSSFTTFSKPQAVIVRGSISARVSDPPAPPPPAPPPPARVYARAKAFAPPPPPPLVYAHAKAFAPPPPPPLVYAHAKAFAPPPPPARVSDPPTPRPPARVYAHAKAFAPPPPPAMESAPPQLHLLSHVLHEKKFVKKQGYQGEQEHPEKMELDGCLKRRPSKRKGKTVRHHGRQSSIYRDPDPEDLKYKWTKIFQLQHSDGFWELTNELGHLINLNVDVLSNVFLKNKGIYSLGMKAHDDVLRMVATLLVLQLLRLEKQEEGKLLQSLFRLEESTQFRPERWDQVKKAVDWVCWADQNYPCICSRLELGLSWDSSTRQLLGFDSLPPFSALIGLELQRSAAPQLI